MKRTLLYIICLMTGFAYAQTPISNFNSAPSSMYATVTSTPDIDQSPTGANVTWTFNNLASSSTATDTYAAPTAAELTTYPGSTSVFTTTQDVSGDETKIFGKQTGAEVSLTGAEGEEFSLNYLTDNALIGTFPLNYNYNNTDAVAGSYSFDNGTATVNGTFSGTIEVTVDAYGTLNMNDVGAGAYSDEVTRLKTEQVATLSIPPFLPNAGTATQVSYYYYDAANGNLVFRSNSVHLVVPIFTIDETTVIYESLLTNLLDVEEQVANEITLVPNPVSDVLHINLKTPQNIKSVIISDVNGRQVLSSTNHASAVNVSHLQTGMYIVRVQTDTALLTRKFIKN